MNKDKKQHSKELKEKISEGLELTYRNLLKEKIKNDGTLVFYENGKIVKIKARDLPA